MKRCTGCGSTLTIDEIRAVQPSALSCCPERDMQEVFELPKEMTPAINHVLGMQNFTTGPVAHAFRAAGHKINRKCEDEQAFVLYWLLKLAIQHGDDWRKAAAAELDCLQAQIKVKESVT